MNTKSTALWFHCNACGQSIVVVPEYGNIPLKCPNCGIDVQSALEPVKPMLPSPGERAVSLDGSEVVFVPEGSFIMGSDLQDIEKAYSSATAKYMDVLWVWFERELPKHEMILPGFWIDVVPVTCTQYQRFCKTTGHRPPEYWQKGEIPETQTHYPVVKVSWEDALAYCLWAGKRLPYESEWEKAARGNDGRIWPWGNEYRDGCGNIDNLGQGIQPVGSYPEGASPYGCLDMAGNVFEWTKDICVPYPGYLETEELRKTRAARMSSHAFKKTVIFRDAASIEETRPFQFFHTIARGGAYGSCAEFSRCTFRLEIEAQGSGSVGFRCILGEETYHRSRDLGKEGRFEEVLALVESSLILSPNYPTALHNAGVALKGLGRYQDAIQRYQQLVDLWPTDHDTWNQLGICQTISGKHQNAIASHDAAISQNPWQADYWYNKSMAIYNLAKTVSRSNLIGIGTMAAEAAGCLELAKRLGGEDDQLKNNLAVANRQEEVLVKYLRGRMDSIEVARLLAQLSFARAFPLVQHVWAVIRNYYPDCAFTYKDLSSRGFATMEASTGLTYLKEWGSVEVVTLETFRATSKKDILGHDPWRNVIYL